MTLASAHEQPDQETDDGSTSRNTSHQQRIKREIVHKIAKDAGRQEKHGQTEQSDHDHHPTQHAPDERELFRDVMIARGIGH